MPISPEELARQRRLNQTRYAIEDLDEMNRRYRGLAIYVLLVIVALIVSWLFGGSAAPHMVGCLVTAAVFLVASTFDLLDRTVALAAPLATGLVLAVECYLAGWPPLLLPFLHAGAYRGFPVFLNELTPYIYLTIRVCVVLAAGAT